ncbi:MAG: hypothetical protein A3H32_09225 [Betaproteobacteria bacterium RIFCSPLOWO2_02_FULL_63_19]|nr:MAG: hypothetical protein A3H32_09225 [Betaproteobacteria bacterium RIFCSPLOWO2_02_FULL_63_19]
MGERVLRGFSWFALVAAIFILAHPYTGVRHDGILYLAQALARLNPETFRGDVFFQWGSQDQYTLFSPLYSWLIVRLGLGHADVTLVLLSQALFLAASLVLVRGLVQPGLRGFAMVFIAGSMGLYGGFFVFRMAEPFVTPRPFVEAATLLAILLVVSGRRGWSIVVLATSAILHPLMALGGMLYWWMYLLVEDRRWFWLLLMGIGPVMAGLAGVAPFAQLFQRFDPQWLDILLRNNGNLFITRWSHFDLGLIAFDLLVLSLGIVLAKGKIRIAFKAALATAVAALGVTFVGADLIHIVFITNVQIWRALWIVHWMALAGLPIVVLRLWDQGVACRLIAGLVLFSFLGRGLPTALAATLVAAIVFHYRERIALSSRVAWFAIGALALGGFVTWGISAYRTHGNTVYDSIDPTTDFLVGALSKPFPLLVLAAAIAWFGLARRNVLPAALVVTSLLVMSCSQWDQRTPLQALAESAPLGSHPFSRIVKPGDNVLWYADLLAPWVLMQRASYFSNVQQSGQMFNRKTAIELQRRKQAVEVLELQEYICHLMNNVNKKTDTCAPDLEHVQSVCEDAKGLDYIVLETRIGNKSVATWTPPVDVGGRRRYYYLYDCKNLAGD